MGATTILYSSSWHSWSEASAGHTLRGAVSSPYRVEWSGVERRSDFMARDSINEVHVGAKKVSKSKDKHWGGRRLVAVDLRVFGTYVFLFF